MGFIQYSSILIVFLFPLILHTTAQSSEPCGAGKFLDSSGKCKLCPPGFFQNKFFPSVSECQPCRAGTFFPISGAQRREACIECPVNTFASKPGSSKCDPCPKGQVSGIGYARCDVCQPNKQVRPFSGVNNPNKVCIDCFRGQFSLGLNNFNCESVLEVCPPSTILPPKSTNPKDCRPCPPGSQASGNECEECREGQFSDGTTTKTCIECPRGSISTKRGSAKCTPCPAGTYQKDAVPIQGYIRPNKCDPCPKGTEALGKGNYFCRKIGGQCPPDYFKNRAGDCRTCLQTERYSRVEDKCVPCRTGLFSRGGTDPFCRKCEQLSLRDQSRSGCQPRQFNCYSGSENRNGKCFRCLPNTFNPRKGLREKCQPCPANTFNLFRGSESCKPCPACTKRAPGEAHCKFDNLKQCRPSLSGCEKGLINKPNKSGEGQCVCPDIIPKELANRCIVCTPAIFVSSGATNRRDLATKKCEICTVFQSTDGFSPCKQCPDANVHLGDGTCGCQAQDRGIINGKCTVCPPGSVGRRSTGQKDNICVPCPSGTYANPQKPPVTACTSRFCAIPVDQCNPCKDGFYNPFKGQASCRKCSEGFGTFGFGAKRCFPVGK